MRPRRIIAAALWIWTWPWDDPRPFAVSELERLWREARSHKGKA